LNFSPFIPEEEKEEKESEETLQENDDDGVQLDALWRDRFARTQRKRQHSQRLSSLTKRSLEVTIRLLETSMDHRFRALLSELAPSSSFS